jgi:hypothetical protein
LEYDAAGDESLREPGRPLSWLDVGTGNNTGPERSSSSSKQLVNM